MKALVDNDVLLKGARYGLLSQFVAAIPGEAAPVGVLGAARYVVRDRIAKRATESELDATLLAFHAFLQEHMELEPTLEEQTIASAIESHAQHAGVDLDAGESQLCAILISRALPLIVTGDKRAICSLETLIDAYEFLVATSGKVMCLEQLVCALIDIAPLETIRNAICGKPDADRTLSICFCCASGASTSRENVEAGMASYINDLRTKAPRILVP